jgi:hypothetical protein
MPLTRLDNLISSKTGKYLYVSPDDFNATDALSNRGNSPVTPFKSIQRAFLEIARYSYLPGSNNDRFDQFSIMLMPGIHYIDNRPGLTDTTGIDVFGFDQASNAWTDDSILDISNPDNILYKFNNTEGGAIIPRGSSLVGYDLRRTVVRPLFVPDPTTTEREIPRSAIFNVTGGCYFWQFTIKDGQTSAESPLFNSVEGTGEVYYDPTDFTKKAAPNYSHHKLTVFEYADAEELSLFYRKIAKGFSSYQPTIDDPGEFSARVQENRIVGPLSDSRVVESFKFNDATTIPSIPASTSEIEVTTKVDHGYFAGQFIAISNTEIDSVLEGIFPIKRIDENDPRKFTYEVAEVVSAIGTGIAAGNTIDTGTTPALGGNALALAEVDSVESASPYVFNCSIRSTWGICGIWANGLKATGFKSMVIAQYTGVSLQKDDRSFIRYDEYSNTWNQASLVDAFATVPYHTKGDSYWKDEWRNFHVRASEDAFIQCVSIFAVGYADHFLMESGGDMSITNSNSNFGNTSLHAIGFKGFAFNQDKGGYITDIIPPQVISTDAANVKKTQYYTIDIQGTVADPTNFTKLFLGSDDIADPLNRPAVSIGGYRLGAKGGEKLFVKLDPATAGGTEEFDVSLEPTGFVKYIAAASILNPSGFAYNSIYADAANLIESNRTMIQEEVFGYIIEKFPALQDLSYVNPGRDPNANRYNDARNLIISNRQDIVNDTLTSLTAFEPTSTVTAEDIGEMVDAIAEDLRDGGNFNVITLIQSYFTGTGTLIKYNGEQENIIWAMNRCRDLCKQASSNLLAVKADLFDPDSASLLAPYGGLPIGTITAGKTGSQAEEDGDTTNGLTLDPAQKIDPGARFRDTYRLINNNRDYILDNALAEITVYDEAPFYYFPGDPQETQYSRFKTAYRLIRRNKEGALDAGITAIQTQYPAFQFIGGSPEKCKRDLGIFVDAIAMDVFLGGNEWTITFIEKYFNGGGAWIGGGLEGEENESIVGFNGARDYLQEAVSNQLSNGYQDNTLSPGESVYGDGNGDVSNTDPTACTDVQNAIATLTSIVTQVINDGDPDTVRNPSNPNYVSPQSRVLQTNENKCRRDIAFIVDAVMQDLWFGGNAYSISMAKTFFDRFGNPINNGLVGEEAQAITAFRRAANAINDAINNQLYYSDQAITLDTVGEPPIVSDTNADAARLLDGNKEWLAEEAYERMIANPLYSSYEPQAQNTKQDCLDDIVNILEQITYDIKFGGNAKTYDSAEIYVTNVMPWFGTDKKRKQFTPTNVTYTPNTGDLVLTIPGHDMTTGNYVRFEDNSLTFTCGMDNNQAQKTYPRAGADPSAGNWVQITAATASSITCNVGATGPNVSYTPTNILYNSTSGVMEITVGSGHGLSVGEGVMIANNSLTFTCDQDSNQTNHTYPRVGQDPYAEQSFTITAISVSTITVNVGVAGTAAGVPHAFVSALSGCVTHSPQTTHTFVSATTDCVNYGLAAATFIDPERDEAKEVFNQVRALVPDVLRNIEIINTGSNTLQQFTDAAIVSDWGETEVGTPTDATYDPATGILAVTVTGHGLSNGDRIQFLQESLTFTCECDGNYENQVYPRTSDPSFDSWLEVANATVDTFEVNVGTSPFVNYNVTNATYDAATGLLNLNIGSGHGLTTNTKIKIADKSLKFKCSMDDYGSVHHYPRSTDPAAGEALNIVATTFETITVNVGASPLVTYTPTNGSYDPNLGLMNLTIGGHDLRGADRYTPSSAAYNPTSGFMTITIADHGFVDGEVIQITDLGLTFSCPAATGQHQFQSGSNNGIVDQNLAGYTAGAGTTYNPTTGELVLEIGAHSINAGQNISIANGAVTFRCEADNYSTDHAYPRASDPVANTPVSVGSVTATTLTVNVGAASANSGQSSYPRASDPVSGMWMPISSVTQNTFDVQVLADAPSTNTQVHTFISAATDCIVKPNSTIKLADDAVTFRCTYGNGVHAFVSGTTGGITPNSGSAVTAAAGTTYDPSNGVLEIEIGSHTLTTANTIQIANGAITFTCDADNNATEHAYPRATDPVSGQTLNITAVTATTITVNVGITNGSLSAKSYPRNTVLNTTVTFADYDPQTGVMELTVPNHGFNNGEQVKIGTGSLTFTCAQDGDQTQHTYPRSSDPVNQKWLKIFNVQTNTFQVQVLDSIPSTNVTNHTFASATTDGLTYKKDPFYDNSIYVWDVPETSFTVSDASYDPATGVIQVTANGWGGSNGTRVKFVKESLTFSCTKDGNGTNHSYPRESDPSYDEWLSAYDSDVNGFKVNVGISGVNDQYAHTFVSATAQGALRQDPSITVFIGKSPTATQPHTFVSALADSVKTGGSYTHEYTGGVAANAVISGGNYPHTFISATSGAVKKQNAAVCANVISAVQSNLDTIMQAIGSDSGVGNLTGITRTTPTQPVSNIQNGVDQAFVAGNCADVISAVNSLVDITVEALLAGNLTVLPALDNGLYDCANVRSSIENLFDIAVDAFTVSNLSQLPVLNKGSFTNEAQVSTCYRDVAYIVDAIVGDLRLGGNINSVQAGEAYYVGNSLAFIDSEKTETLDAWNYVGQMATAAMRNFDFLAYNCTTTAGSAIVDVGDTRGIIIGMTVTEYDDTDPSAPAYVNGVLQTGSTPVYTTIGQNVYVKRIINNTEIELGVENSRLDFGQTINAQQSSGTIDLFFDFPSGQWADTLPKTVIVGPESISPDIIADTTTGNVITDPADPNVGQQIRECAGTVNAIETLVSNINTIINSGPGAVTRQEQTANVSLFSQRGTVFTINTSGLGGSNPHQFETGTPVRLVPRPRFDVDLGQYVDVDKRLIRLPDGFSTNETYYVIAPGRKTQPFDYSNTTFFNGSDQTKLMLATSRENAAAGIFIYASEADSIDPNVEIDIYQFILDENYDLHRYKCKLSTTVVGGITTDVPHIFDVPFSSVTPHKVFFRSLAPDDLPTIGEQEDDNPEVTTTDINDDNFGRLNPVKEFYARYQTARVFTIHKSHADAINNADPIQFTAGQSDEFNVFCNKRRSPVKYDPTFSVGVATEGKWYVDCINEADPQNVVPNVYNKNIIWRLKQDDYSDRPKTTDTWFTRLDDSRPADDRTYKLRYVIPSYLENARDPINGFVIKTRTDDTRKLVPQKVLLKPVAGEVYGARFENPVQAGEYIGYKSNQFLGNGLNEEDAYDPYKNDTTGQGIEYKAYARFNSGIQATIQSARYVQDPLVQTISYLELDVVDHTVDIKNFPGLKNEQFTTVQINAPQGGDWVTNKTASITANQVEWTGNSSGIANIHGYYENAGSHYLILKNIRGGKLEFSEFYNTRFTQGSTFADMLEDQDMGKSLPLKTLIKKGYPEYYYRQNGSNVYTITPGDRIQDSAGVEYYVASVEDTGIIEDTFYIFNYETLQKRISGQQDGIYYLSCLRGNISPLPQGAGAGGNFRDFQFSQPVSSLYPLNYKNDPLWFQKAGTTAEEKNVKQQLIDPPATYSAADNYTHGLVRTNDYKNSVTRELVEDFIVQPAFIENDYQGTSAIRALPGNATSGSEDRRIPISGTSTVLVDQKYYVELRRPSIARAGNHTFEYLGFGPGNYSTGLPARQEIVLTPTEDFYAQSKKQNAGIVFYTGLNSNGDLYIGNRKINAITGQETYLEAAVLKDSDDDDEDIGDLVTSFDTPVTFNQNITVVGGDGSLQNVFQSPLVVSVQDNDLTQSRDALIIRSNVSSVDPVTNLQQDEGLDRTAWTGPGNPLDGDIRISKNRVDAAVFGFNSRGKGQKYQIQTHTSSGLPSNITPNNNELVNIDPNTGINLGGSKVEANQSVNYGSVQPKSGDMLLKGLEVGKTGSLGWIYANYFNQIPANNIFTIEFDGTNVVKLTFKDIQGNNIANSSIGISDVSQIKLTNFSNPLLNSSWLVFSPNGDAFSSSNNYVHFQVNNGIGIDVLSWNGAGGVLDTAQTNGNPVPIVEFSNSNWKEYGVLGAEALRTETETIGDYKLGVNTVARTEHPSALKAFTSDEATPRANLDVVGTAFVSGKTINSYLADTTINKTETAEDNAFLVGGDSTDPDDSATLRVMTTNTGRVGVNTKVEDTVNPQNELDRNFVVVGNSRFTGDSMFMTDIEVNGGDITTTNTAFNFVNSNANILNWAGDGQILTLMNNSTSPQTYTIGGSSPTSTWLINEAAATTNLYFARNTTKFKSEIGTVEEAFTSECEITLGGGFATSSPGKSNTKIGTFYTGVAGQFEFGYGYGAGTSSSRIFSQTREVNAFDGSSTNTVNLATNATQFTLGSTGGNTTIRNTLNVLASTIVEGNIRLDGGLNAGIVEIGRGRFGTSTIGHQIGGLENPNIDFYKYESTGRRIDTAGVAPWGSTLFLQGGGQIASVDNIVNNGSTSRTPGTYQFLDATGSLGGLGAAFTILIRFDFTIDITIESGGEGYADNETLTITDAQLGGGGGGDLTFDVNGVNAAGNNYYLPITTPSVNDFQLGDLLLIDRQVGPQDATGQPIAGYTSDESKSEIVQVIGIDNISNPNDPQGFRLIVTRGIDGTASATDHPDSCVIAKLDKQSNSSYITGSDLDGNGELDEPLTGIGADPANVNIGVAEFGGTITTQDYFRLSGLEFCSIEQLISTSPQSLQINDGGDPAAIVFNVESTTGNTQIFGNITAGSGFNKFTMDSNSGNTAIAGTLTVEDTFTVNGSTIEGQQWFRLTNGGATGIPIRTTLEVDTASGDLTINGGDINIFGTDETTPRLTFNNSSGDFTTYGSFSALGTGTSTFGGDIDVTGDAFIRGGDLTVYAGENTSYATAGDEIFGVDNNGAVKIAGIENYFSQTGARKWLYEAESFLAEANVNYFVNCTGNTLIKLPAAPEMGDMIRIIDISGSLSYNLSMVVRAPDNVKVQGESSNTGTTVLPGIAPSTFVGYEAGGELVVQTPNAAFSLVYAGNATPDGGPGAPSSLVGWYLTDV